jgi:acetoin utilization deacetylase AcuC-like enzyme
MATLLITDKACFDHEPGLHHPESPKRLEAVLAALSGAEFARLERRSAPMAGLDLIVRVHPEDFARAVLATVPAQGHRALDGDTILSPGSGLAALHAAGAACAAVDAVATGAARNAFCAVRPPGHHAEPRRAMGFCLFNNVAIGAAHARAAHGLRRVAVVDFDVHHGNGTQAFFERDASYFLASTHQAPLYPGTGSRRERGVGNIVNVPLPPGTTGQQFRRAVSDEVLPALDAFRPDIILVSAGFDAHEADPLASLRLTEADFGWITERLVEAATRLCSGRLVSTLEGGYDLGALAASAAAHVRGLLAA